MNRITPVLQFVCRFTLVFAEEFTARRRRRSLRRRPLRRLSRRD
ncbi:MULTISPECIES: hypothetical protein [unclassified Stenotrophomonas]|nr:MULTISPECIES: hypothetical protein [unclassified Stenotrophomonas]